MPAPNDMRKWNLAMLRAYARRMARRPSRQVQALRQVSKRLGLVPQVYEWETTNSQGRHFWVDIRAGRMGKSLGPVYLDGTWDSIRRPPPAKNLEVLVAKAEHLEVLRLPYLIVAVHDRGDRDGPAPVAQAPGGIPIGGRIPIMDGPAPLGGPPIGGIPIGAPPPGIGGGGGKAAAGPWASASRSSRLRPASAAIRSICCKAWTRAPRTSVGSFE